MNPLRPSDSMRSMNLGRIGTLVGKSRCAVPARQEAGGFATSSDQDHRLEQAAAPIAPITPARPTHRDVPYPWISVKPVEIVIWARNPNSFIFPNRNRNLTRNPRVLPLKQRGGLRLRLRLRLGEWNWSGSSLRLNTVVLLSSDLWIWVVHGPDSHPYLATVLYP